MQIVGLENIVSNTRKLLCLGYGYTARALATMLSAKGWQIAGTTTSEQKAAAMSAANVDAFLWDGNGLDANVFSGANALLISTPPDGAGCPALNVVSASMPLQNRNLRWIGYLSTNGVYGDHHGAWVNEDSELRGHSDRAKRRIAAEQAWREFADANNLPLIIFRLPGIYGPERSALDSVRAGRAVRIYKEGQVFSRMHVDDIAAALASSIDKPHLHQLYNLADDEPAPPQDVIEYACTLLNKEPPPLIPIKEADLSDMAKSFYADNKRVSNERMKTALGVKLRHPTYREGLTSIFKGEQQRV